MTRVTEFFIHSDADIIPTLHGFASNKKSGFERESAAIAFHSLSTVVGAPIAPLLLPSLPVLYELYMDKGDVVRLAAVAATKSILKLFPADSIRIVFRTLEAILENGKWRTKVAALDALRSFVNSARDAVANELVHTLPKVEAAMHDTKQEVSLPTVIFSDTLIVNTGLVRCQQMCHCAVHYSCQRGSQSTYSNISQMYGRPRFRSRLHQIIVIDNIRGRSHCSGPSCPCSIVVTRSQ